MFKKLFLFFFFFALCDLADADPIKLTKDDGTGQLTSFPAFSVIDQCYGSMGEYAHGSYRIQFRVVGKGHCQLYLCYPSQLDPDSVIDGMAPEIGYQLPNVNKRIVQKCMDEMGKPGMKKIDGQLHGIFIDVDVDHISMSMSFYGKNFSIESNNFMLELAKAAHSSISTKMHIFDEKTKEFVQNEKDEFAEDEQIRRQFFQLQHQGALLADFPGLWLLALDMLPSDFDPKQKLKIFTLGSRDTKHSDHKICNINRGIWAEDNCRIEANPNDNEIKYDGEAVNGSKTTELALPYNLSLNKPLKMGDKIYITGRLLEPKSGFFKVHLLHDWKEPDLIMGETILSILVRPNYIYFTSYYNFTGYKKVNNATTQHIGQRLDQDIEHKFSMQIAAHGNGNYSLVLNCLDEDKTFFFVQNEAVFPLGYILTDYILIETEGKWANPDDNPWQLHNFYINKSEPTSSEQIHSNVLAPIPTNPSYSLKLNTDKLDNDIFIIVKLKLPKNPDKFDINLVRHDGKRNEGAILVHFHANLIGGYYVLGRCQKTCKEWTDTKTIDASNAAYKQLEGDGEFELMFAQLNNKADLIFINGILIHQMPKLDKPNYIQFKGDVILSNLAIQEQFSFVQEYSLESAFKPFNEILFQFKLVPNYNKYKIRFNCKDEGKCGKALSNVPMELHYSKKILTLLTLNYDDESISNEILIHVTENVKLSIYANQYEYKIFWDDKRILTANYWQFPTPDQIDTITIDLLYNLTEGKPLLRKEWKQYDSDIALPFVYRLDKTLEIGSTIQIKLKLWEVARHGWEAKIHLFHDANQDDSHFGKLLFFMDLTGDRNNFFAVTPNTDLSSNYNSTYIKGYMFSTNFQLEIVVYPKHYQILIDGKELIIVKHLLPVWMVDYVRFDSKYPQFTLFEAKITWPSDFSTKWLEPSNEISLRPANSKKVDLAGAKKINMQIQMVENYKLINVFLMTRCQKWNESEIYKKVCVAPFIVKFEFNSGEITEEYNGQLRVEKGKFDVGKTSFYLDFDLHDMKNSSSWDIKNSFHKGAVGKINYKMENINYIQVTGDVRSFQTKIELAKNLGMPRGVPLFIKLARPLCIDDVILIKGKLLSALNVKRRLAILLQHSIPDDEFPFQILNVLIVYNFSAVNEKNGNNTKLRLYRDMFDTNGTAKLHNISESEFFDSMQQVDVSIRVQKKQFEVEHKGKNNVTLNADHDGWFWAVQYIKFFFLHNSGDSENSSPTIAMYKGYPKITHQYPKGEE